MEVLTLAIFCQEGHPPADDIVPKLVLKLGAFLWGRRTYRRFFLAIGHDRPAVATAGQRSRRVLRLL
jgi:hypothetical protein